MVGIKYVEGGTDGWAERGTDGCNWMDLWMDW